MTLSIAKGKHPLVALLGLMAASLAILPLLPPIPQDPSYHQFADQRTLLGIPNFWNVVSNLPFVLVGAMRLWQFGRDRASFVLFLGVFLTGFGSAYYHWDPNDDTLFWAAADGAHFYGNTRRCGRGACECKGRSHSAVAAACISGLQPLALALD